MSKKVYIVTAQNEDGIIALEVFKDEDDALAFDKDGIIDQVRTEYGESAASSDKLLVGFHIRKLK